MNRSLICHIVGVFLIMVVLPEAVLSYYGGDGTYQNPYQIATAEDLIELGQSSWDYDKHFVMISDIDLAGYEFTQAVIPPSDEYYNNDGGFRGTFNGNGHIIHGLQISGSEDVGLFGILGECGVISQLGVVDANVIGNSYSVGIVVGYNYGTVSRCFSTGAIQGESGVGGLIGANSGIIENCYSCATISGLYAVGGLVGRFRDYDSGSYILNCYSAGTVVSEENYGGLLGWKWGEEEVLASFWDAESSGISGGQGLSTEQMMDINSYLEAGWDFGGEDENGSYEIWIMPAGGGYPVLSVFQGVSSPCPADIGVNLGLCILSEDPNEVVWDAPEQFSSQWDIVSLIESRHNPVVALDPNTLDSRISIEIQGHLESVANDRLIGLDLENIIPCQALDGDGNSIELGNVIGPFEPWHPWILMPNGMKLFELNHYCPVNFC